MNPLLQNATTALAIVVSVAAAVCVIRNRLPGWPTVWGLIALEAALVVVMIAGVVQLALTDREVDSFSLVGYLLTLLILVPAGTMWAFVERTRHGTAVIIIACLAVPVMLTRTQQIWEAGVAR